MAIVVDGGWEMVGISTSISRSDLTETLGDSERFLRRTSDAAHHLDPRGCCDLRTKKYGLYVERKVVSPITPRVLKRQAPDGSMKSHRTCSLLSLPPIVPSTGKYSALVGNGN